MGLRDASTTQYEFGPCLALVRPNNPDGGEISVSRVVSDGAGPFDFSSAAVPASVTISIKTDAADWVDDTIDLSAVGDIAAVTVAELVTALTTAAVTNLTAEAEAVTGYLKLSLTTPGSAKYFQVKGEVAELTGMGYGYGAVVVAVNTQQSIAREPVAVDSARIEITDAKGKNTAVVSDGYNTGMTYTLVDTARDAFLKAIVEGGLFQVDTEFAADKYLAPTSDDVKPVLTIEYYQGLYTKDDNQESNVMGYTRYKAKSVKGTVGGLTGDRNIQAYTYTLNATGYQDPLTGSKSTYEEQDELTVAEFTALDLTALDYRA